MKLTFTALLFGTSGLVAFGPATEACATSNIFFRLDAFSSEARPSFYYSAEDQGSTSFLVRRTGHDCEFTPATVAFDVQTETAEEGVDYESTSDRTVGLRDSHDAAPDSQSISVPVIDDGQQESVESASVVLSDPREESATPRLAHLGDPAAAPLYIVDDEGPTRFSFGDGAYSQSERSTSVALPVFRSGDASGTGNVSFDIEQGSAVPGQDYVAPDSGQLSFGAGERMKLLSFSLVDDTAVESEETLQITLVGAADPSSVVVTIENDDVAEGIPPTSRLHHPRHGARYPPDQFDFGGIHILTRDSRGGSGVVKAHFALRRLMSNGACVWFTRDGFNRGACGQKVWIRGRALEQGSFYIYTIKRLRPSVGGPVRKYTMWSRAVDGAGNVETNFQSNRNANTFEITRR